MGDTAYALALAYANVNNDDAESMLPPYLVFTYSVGGL